MISLNRRGITYCILALVLGYFLFCNIHMLNNELWNDEIYTLKKFTLGHVRTTLTDYHSTNNHIFYNVFNHFYLKLLGINDLKTLFEHPWILRLPLLLLSLITLAYSYRFGKLAAGRTAGLITAVLLVTTVPFQNFSMQVRGYSFSMFFDLALAFYLLRFLETPKAKYFLLIAMFSFLAVYSIPLNLYCIAAIGLFLFLDFVLIKVSTGKFDLKYIRAAAALFAGMVLVLICFIPIMHVVFNNEFVNGVNPFSKWAFEWLLPVVTKEFISNRYLVLILCLCAVPFYFFTLARKPSTNAVVKMLLLILLVPFVMVFIRGEEPADRTFIYMAPFFCALLAVLITPLFRLVPGNIKPGVLALFIICVLLTHHTEMRNVETHMNDLLKTEKRSQSMYYPYFLYNYHPLEVARYIKKGADQVILKDSEPHDMPDYLNAFGIPAYDMDSIDCFLDKGKVLLITRYPGQLDEAFCRQHNCVVKEVMYPSFHHLLQLTTLPVSPSTGQ